MPYMYIVRCSDDSFYVSSTWDLERRMTQHNEGEGAEYTRHRLPVVLVYYEWMLSMEAAYRREKQVQNWSRAKRIALITGNTDALKALSRNSGACSRRVGLDTALRACSTTGSGREVR